MSRLYTALQRSNTTLLESDVKTAETEPSTDERQPAKPAPAETTESKRPEPERGGRKTSGPEREIPDLTSPERTSPERESPDRGSNIPVDAGAVSLPPLLIDTSPSFRREIALLHHSLVMLAQSERKSLLICSAESGAGTSSIALNMAAYASAETTGKALLVEANFEHPYIHRLTRRTRPGLSDFLTDQGRLEQYIYPTSTAGLHVMSAGRVTGQSNTLILESRVRYLLTEAQQRYPFIVLDSAPVNSQFSTLELAKAVDGVILVARPNTLTSQIVQARTALDHVGANTLGFAFNDF